MKTASVRTVRAVVVDDEPAARDAVITMLAEHADVNVVASASNGREAVRIIRHEKPDLLFLDIQMPDLDGFGVLQQLGGDAPRGVVFVTAHDEHALRAFDVHALDYLLKPFGRPRFNAAVRRALERLHALDALSLQRTLTSMHEDRTSQAETPGLAALSETGPRSAPRRIAVRNGTRITLVDVSAIDWVEACGDYARIHAGTASHLLSQRMREIEDLLDPAGFVRVHRSVIVNLDRIRELVREHDGGGVLVLANGIRLRVARGRWDPLQRALERIT